MKLEEVLPHLRVGGKVRIGMIVCDIYSFTLIFNQVFGSLLTVEGLQSDIFEIVEEPYKEVFIRHSHVSEGHCYKRDVITIEVPKSGKYKITLEDAEE
jgi:hypothetical protein